jgi:predicted ATPase
MSDGTLRFLAILTALMTRPSGSLLVIEEVDNGLHPSRARLLLGMLREIGSQQGVDVLVTTHNPALLDAMGTEMVPYITVAHRGPATGHSMLTLLEDIERLPKLLAQGPIGRLSSQGLIEESLSGVRA